MCRTVLFEVFAEAGENGGGQQFRLECVRAYNDSLIEWCGQANGRLIPVASLPLWDVEAAVAEMERATAIGHRGFLLCNEPEKHPFHPRNGRRMNFARNALLP